MFWKVGLISIALVLAAVLSLGVVRGVHRPAAILTRQQIEQRAIEYARNDLQGIVTAATTRRTTLGQQGIAICDLYSRLVRPLLAGLSLIPYNSCDPHTEFWMVDLQGTFHWPQSGVSDHIGVRIQMNGDLMSSFGEVVRVRPGVRTTSPDHRPFPGTASTPELTPTSRQKEPITATNPPHAASSTTALTQDTFQLTPAPSAAPATPVIVDSADTPEATINAYYAHLDAGECEQAYALRATSDQKGSLEAFVDACHHWAGAKVVSIQTMRQVVAEQKGAAFPELVGTKDKPRYVVKVDMRWLPGWQPILPPGIHEQWMRLAKEDGKWKIFEIGF